jgi:hypothetical protein
MLTCLQPLCHDILDAVRGSKMTIFQVEFEFWNEESGESHTHSDQESRGASEPMQNGFGSKLASRRGQCDRERSRDAESKCLHVQLHGKNVVGVLVF